MINRGGGGGGGGVQLRIKLNEKSTVPHRLSEAKKVKCN